MQWSSLGNGHHYNLPKIGLVRSVEQVTINWYGLTKQIHMLLWLTKKWNFVLYLWADISQTQHFILKVDTTWTIMSLIEDTRANKMDVLRSTRGMRDTPSKAINMTKKKGFCATTGIYWRSWNLVNPTVHYCTIARCHQHRLLSLSRRGTCTHSQERSVTWNCH